MPVSRASSQALYPVPEVWRRIEQHWVYVVNAAWTLFALLPWAAPVCMQLGWAWAGQAIYFFYSLFSHQLPERSWFLFGPQFSYTIDQLARLGPVDHELLRRTLIGDSALGWKVAWSDRAVAMYTSIAGLGWLYALQRRQRRTWPPLPWWGFMLLITPLALDGLTHLVNDALRLDFRDTNLWAIALTGGAFPSGFYAGDHFLSLNSSLRLLTGFLFGLGTVGFIWPVLDREVTRLKDLATTTPSYEESGL